MEVEMSEQSKKDTQQSKTPAAAEVLAIALGQYIRKASLVFMERLYEPGLEKDIKLRIVRAITNGFSRALDEAVTVEVTDKGALIPRFNEDKFYEALGKGVINETGKPDTEAAQGAGERAGSKATKADTPDGAGPIDDGKQQGH